MSTALASALLSSICFGVALVTGRIGLRSLDARAGATVSIPTATALFVLVAPFILEVRDFSIHGAFWFAVVGLFFPAVVTVLTFRSNQVLGPTVTGAVSGTAPLFALLAAAVFLGERIPTTAIVAAIAVGTGVALISWRRNGVKSGISGLALLWPISGAIVRGFAQAGAKAALLLWPNPFAASLIGYTVSSATVIAGNRFRRSQRSGFTRHGVLWFALTGALNGGAVLLMYTALTHAPVALVAPVVAAYPLVTALTTALVLREDRPSRQMMAGATITVLGIACLVGSPTSN